MHILCTSADYDVGACIGTIKPRTCPSLHFPSGKIIIPLLPSPHSTLPHPHSLCNYSSTLMRSRGPLQAFIVQPSCILEGHFKLCIIIDLKKFTVPGHGDKPRAQLSLYFLSGKIIIPLLPLLIVIFSLILTPPSRSCILKRHFKL